VGRGIQSSKAVRAISATLGAWPFISAFAWPHSAAQFTNTWLVAVTTVATAIAAMRAPALGYVNTALGAWLVISALALAPKATATAWNNALVGVALVVTSLVSGSKPGGLIPRDATVVRR
jgi:hypothetical protein